MSAVDDEDAGEGFAIECEIAKVEDNEDEGYTFIYGPVLVPEEVDHQDDIVSADEIMKAAHGFMEGGQKAGLMHKMLLGSDQACIVESHIQRQPIKIGKSDIPEGTWMIGMRVYDTKLRKLIKKGTLGAFSIGGKGKSVEEVVEEVDDENEVS